MNHDYRPLVALPDGLCDADAVKLFRFLLELTHALGDHYDEALLRNQHRPDPRQRDLWDDDPPF
jgi:hypothetical protein